LLAQQKIEALEAQQAMMIRFVQQLGQQHGWEMPPQLFAPTPPPSTIVSMSMSVSLFYAHA
jgi:hypothetical protein